jgi:hypothetical protein
LILRFSVVIMTEQRESSTRELSQRWIARL